VRSIDGGATWAAETSGTRIDLYDVGFADSLRGIAVGDSGTILLTTDGGVKWSRTQGGTSSMLMDICLISADTAIAAGSGGVLLWSSDGGNSWERQTSGTANTLKGISFANRNTGCVVGFNGTILWTNTWTAVDEGGGAQGQGPYGIVLAQNYPNPFNPTTKISYSLGVVSGQWSVASRVRLAVYDILGREVAVLVDEEKQPGSYEVRFDGTGFGSGVYLCRIQSGGRVETRKMLLLR
jgi:hypothetical protein